MPGFEVIGQEEQEQVNEVFAKGGILFRHSFDALRNGVYKVRDFERAFNARLGTVDALAVTSGTAAIRVALAALGVGPGRRGDHSELHFRSHRGGYNRVRRGSGLHGSGRDAELDPTSLEASITPRTKAIIVVHMLGTPARRTG